MAEQKQKHHHYHLFPDNPFVWVFLAIAVLAICDAIVKVYK